MLKNALIYARVSTEEQAEDGRMSLTTQQRLCSKAIEESKEYKLASDGVYIDAGKSATNMNRPALQDMLIRVQEDKSIGAVFVQDTDRISRNANDHLTIKALLQKHNAKLISVSQPGIEDSPEGNFMDLVIAGVNQFQSQITGRKTRKSMEQRFWDGWFPTRAPLGYLNVGDPNSPDKRIIIEDPQRGPLMRQLFELYSTGNYNLLEVRDLMFEKGLLNWSGRRLSRSQVAQVLDNTFYYGEMRWKDKVNKGKHPPLITKELHDKCVRIKAEHNNFASRMRKYNFLLRGFVYCASCGQRWTAEHHPKKNKSYYRCNAQPAPVRCKEKFIETTSLELQVERKFQAIQFSKEFIDRVLVRVQALYEKKKSEIVTNQAGLLNQKNALLKKLETAEEKLISGILSDEAFSRVKSKLTPQIEVIEENLFKLDRTRNVKIDVIQKVLNLVRDLSKTYSMASPELKRTYLGLFWTKFEVSNGSIVTATPTSIVSALANLGMVNINQTEKALSAENIFSQGNTFLKENIKITTERGAQWESNPYHQDHNLEF